MILSKENFISTNNLNIKISILYLYEDSFDENKTVKIKDNILEFNTSFEDNLLTINNESTQMVMV